MTELAPQRGKSSSKEVGRITQKARRKKTVLTAVRKKPRTASQQRRMAAQQTAEARRVIRFMFEQGEIQDRADITTARAVMIPMAAAPTGQYPVGRGMRHWTSLSDVMETRGPEAIDGMLKRLGFDPMPDEVDTMVADVIEEKRQAEQNRRRSGNYADPEVLAEILGLNAERRRALNVRAIGAVDKCADERRAIAREREREYQRRYQKQKRKAEGRLSREMYLAESVEAAKPWTGEGISRRTWYRRQAMNIGTGLSSQNVLGTGVSCHPYNTLEETAARRA